MSSFFTKIPLCMSLIFLVACTSQSEKKELTLAIWAHYLSSETLQKFEKENSVRLRLVHFSSNEELLAKIQMNPDQFDVVVPSDYMVSLMIKQNLLQPLDLTRISHLKNIEPRYLNLGYDPKNQFSVPYAWTTAGIAIHRDLYKKEIKTLSALFQNSDLKGQISALDDIREMAAAALKIQGSSVNSRTPAEVQKAFHYLKTHKSQFKAFNSNAVDLLLNGEIKAGLVYSSDALLAQKQNPKIDYRIPQEGSTWAVDNLVILKSSRQKELAHQLIQFLSTAENNRDLVLNVRVGPVIKGTKDLLPEALQNNPGLFPDEKVFSKLEMLQDLGDAQTLYENQWTDFKTTN